MSGRRKKIIEDDKLSRFQRDHCCKRLLSRRTAIIDTVRLVSGARLQVVCYVNTGAPEIKTVIYVKR